MQRSARVHPWSPYHGLDNLATAECRAKCQLANRDLHFCNNVDLIYISNHIYPMFDCFAPVLVSLVITDFCGKKCH